jgi:membrane protease YdiL (CAAX protease family)
LRYREGNSSLSSADNPQPESQPEPQAVIGETQFSVPAIAYSFPPAAPPAPTRIAKAGENPVWSGWDVLVIAVLTVGMILVTQLVTVLVVREFTHPRQSWIELAQKPSLALLSEFLAYIPVLIYMVLVLEGKYHTRFWSAIRWNWPGAAGLSFLGVGVLMLGFDALGRFLPMPKNTPFDQFFDRPLDAYLTAAFAITLGPLMEELFFRGFLYPVIARRLGAVWGILLTALPFGAMHYLQYRSWAAVLIIVLVGVVLTTIRAVTKSVGASFLAHVGYNTTLMVLAAVATDGFRHVEKMGVWAWPRG